MNVRIREAVPADAEAIRAVHYRSIVSLGRAAYEGEQVDAWAAGCGSADYAGTVADGDVAAVVAQRGGALVGFGTLVFRAPDGYEADPDAELTAAYVDPSVARRDVGGRIHAALEGRARARGVGTLGLRASRNAVPFYEAQGYERVADRVHEFSPGESTGVTGTVVEMRKEL